MKKLCNKLWEVACIALGYTMALVILVFAVLLPLTGVTGLLWLLLKMLGVI